MLQGGQLLIDGLGPALVGKAQGVDPDAGGKVDVVLAVKVHAARVLAPLDGHGEARVGVHDGRLVPLLNVAEVQV